jgi:hypothetical protein
MNLIVSAVAAVLIQGIGSLIINAISSRADNSYTVPLRPRWKKSRSTLKAVVIFLLLTAVCYFTLIALPFFGINFFN